MKTYKTAKTILKHALEDIEAGMWCKGQLAEYGTCGVLRVGEDNLYCLDTFEAHEKPMGCALGLLATYGGLGKEKKYKINGVVTTFFVPTYPSFNHGREIEKALVALATAVPKSHRQGLDTQAEQSVIETIYSYNDMDHVTKDRAVRWFRKALATVS